MGDFRIMEFKGISRTFSTVDEKQLVDFGMKCPGYMEEKIFVVLDIIGLRLRLNM